MNGTAALGKYQGDGSYDDPLVYRHAFVYEKKLELSAGYDRVRG